MKISLGSKIMIAGVLLMAILGWWTLNAYTSYTNCVRQKVNEVDMAYLTSSSSLNSIEYQNAVERAILSCPTNGMEIAGAGVFGGFIVFITGIVKSFLDKRAGENPSTSNQVIINGNATGSNIIIGNENTTNNSQKENNSQ